MHSDTFQVCQDTTNEQVKVSRYCLDQSLETHSTITATYPAALQPPPPSIVDWLSKKDTKLWFRDIFTMDDTECSGKLSSISVPIAIVQRTSTTQTIQFTKERGYNIRPGDIVTVARGPEYEEKGVVQSVDFPNARLTLLCDGDHSLASTINLY
ncbi:uncharacterized protein EDB93DRAFT_1110428 [Suillus bovinus]|uniref:uncharacterized protein n=1 Tax=Suillus bovinus TaxID=48563 RepID=UPI001B869A43|nr:uncharacterized protein EDB93DRAFT_1110428 [Suillus bovinus]KAG2124846.1 hypothetical protein EDB93DRAFT_1110428 [Suillus bovinus]